MVLPSASDRVPGGLIANEPKDVTAARVLGNVYKNDTEVPRIVLITLQCALAASADQAGSNVTCDSIDGLTTPLASAIFTLTVAGLGPGTLYIPFMFIVPPGFKYSLADAKAGTGVTTIINWIEYGL